MRLRVKDIDFDQMLIEIHNAKGDKSRFALLPKQLVEPLRKLVESREALHERDLANGEASVWLPYALDRKYPSAHKELKWQFLFASAKFSRDPKTGKRHGHHLMQGGIGSENPQLPQGKPPGFRAPPLGSDYGDFYSVILKLG